MKKYLAIIVILSFLLAVYIFVNRKEKAPVNSISPSTLNAPEVTWKEYKSKELKISFSYPSIASKGLGAINESFGVIDGTTGKSFQAIIPLSSNSRVLMRASTKDYSAEKGGFGVGTEGFVFEEGKYHIITKGTISDVSFVPDKVVKLSNGSDVLIIYGKNFDAGLDYPDSAAKGLMSIPNNETFTGIGFILSSFDDKGQRTASSEELETFDRIINSIEFIN